MHKLYPYQQAFLDAAKAGLPFGFKDPRQSGKTQLLEEAIQTTLHSGQPVLVVASSGVYVLRMDDPCDEVDHMLFRPLEPCGDKLVWYRGWELGFSPDAEYWGGEGWIAYKGGCDLDAPELRAGSFVKLLEAIEDDE